MQASRIKDYSARLSELRHTLTGIKANLHEGWKAQEMTYVDGAFQSINKKLAEISSELNSLGADIISVANEIKREEELKAKEEREKAERERAEREKARS